MQETQWRHVTAWVMLSLSLAACGAAGPAGAAEAMVAPAASMDSTEGLGLKEAGRIVPEGPGGAKVLRLDGPFSGRIDLKAKGIEPRKYDLIKIEIKTDAHAWLRFSLENFPKDGQLSHWYVLDATRGQKPWGTIWIDMNRPEEIKEAGRYKGMAEKDPAARGLRFDGQVTDLKRAIQGPGRSIWLGRIRFVKKAIDLDWDQTKAPYTWEKGKDLVFTYPLKVTNRLDRPVTAVVKIRPHQVTHATAKLSLKRVALAAGETKGVQAMVSLPAKIAAKAAPLYCERFLAVASAEGVADSEVTILRSSDPIHLTVTVPIPEAKLKLPLMPRRKDLPVSLTGFRADSKGLDAARAAAKRSGPDDLDQALDGPLDVSWAGRRGFNYWGKGSGPWHQAGWRYLRGLTACAFLYDFTGEKQYLEKGTAMLLRAADRWPDHCRQWRRTKHAPISHGVFSANALSLGWSTGSMRPVYSYQRHGMFNDFDLLAKDMSPKAREKILRDFILPAAVHMRNHYFGLTNQQDVINYPVMYAGLVGRNWPLVSHAYSGSHGVKAQIKWNFDDDGLCGEGNYHVPAIEPILWSTELLHQVGIDLYDRRLYTILHSKAAKVIRKGYHGAMLPFTEKRRFTAKDKVSGGKTDGSHLPGSGLTLLRWKGREVSMNWGMQMNRSAPDRCALRINGLGGGNYTHSSLGQSIIIIDEGVQKPVRAKVTGVDVTGPVQYVQAVSDRHYPGTTITRTFALIDGHVLVVDRAASNKPRTVDWCLRYKGGVQTYKDVAKGITLKMAHRDGSFTDKPNDAAHGVSFGRRLKSKGHFLAVAEGPWRQANGEMLMAAAPGTEVLTFSVAAAFSAWRKERQTGVPVMMVRRRKAARADYVAVFSKDAKAVERVAVTKADGSPADAIGVKVTLAGGKVFHAIVNHAPAGTEVRLGKLKTAARFATDY